MTVQELRIGLISDTHGLFRPSIRDAFRGVSLIVHAGDVGGARVVADLAAIAPVEAVYGNVDEVSDPQLARERTVPLDGLTLHVSHGHEFGSPTPARVADAYDADILVFGHTHRAVVTSDTRGDRRRLIVNPGAAGPRRFHIRPSVAILTIRIGTAHARIVEIA